MKLKGDWKYIIGVSKSVCKYTGFQNVSEKNQNLSRNCLEVSKKCPESVQIYPNLMCPNFYGVLNGSSASFPFQ